MNNKTPRIHSKLYPLRNWGLCEQFLFWINIIVSTSFFIYGCIEPKFIKSNDIKIAYVLNVFSYVANLFNVLSILISTQKKISRFWYGIIAAIALGVIAFLNGATGSWILYWIFQLPLQFVGYYLWKKSSIDKIKIKPTKMKFNIMIFGLIIIIGLIALWSWIDSLRSFQMFWYGKVLIKQSWVVYICDGGIFIIGLAAAIMMLFRYREEWILWIILDILCIILWSMMLNVQMIIMSSTALINGCYGIYAWYRK